jgi:hypothetical protein
MGLPALTCGITLNQLNLRLAAVETELDRLAACHAELGICQAPPACAAGTINPTIGHCYETFAGDVVTWHEAVAACEARGGYLVTISDADENEFVRGLSGGDWWGGLSDIGLEGDFIWVNGEPTTYTNWDPGQPDNNSGFQDCLRMNSGVWDDDECNAETGRSFPYICEYE